MRTSTDRQYSTGWGISNMASLNRLYLCVAITYGTHTSHVCRQQKYYSCIQISVNLALAKRHSGLANIGLAFPPCLTLNRQYLAVCSTDLIDLDIGLLQMDTRTIRLLVFLNRNWQSGEIQNFQFCSQSNCQIETSI